MKDPDAHKELNDLSTFLAGLKKQNAFLVPDNYFIFLQDEIKKRQDENSLSGELNEYDFLKKHKTNPGSSLKIPEGYFEKLPEAILQKAKKQTEPPKQKGVEIMFRQFRGIAVAASVAAMLFLGMTLLHPSYKITSVATTLNQDDINKYIQQNITDFDDQIIASQSGQNYTLQPQLIKNATDSASYNDYLRDASQIDISAINNLQNN
jgi:hypothetical protein